MSHPELADYSRPNAAVIASQNDAFRRFACLGIAPDQPIQGRLVVTQSLIEAGDGFIAAQNEHHVENAGSHGAGQPQSRRRYVVDPWKDAVTQ